MLPLQRCYNLLDRLEGRSPAGGEMSSGRRRVRDEEETSVRARPRLAGFCVGPAKGNGLRSAKRSRNPCRLGTLSLLQSGLRMSFGYPTFAVTDALPGFSLLMLTPDLGSSALSNFSLAGLSR